VEAVEARDEEKEVSKIMRAVLIFVKALLRESCGLPIPPFINSLIVDPASVPTIKCVHSQAWQLKKSSATDYGPEHPLFLPALRSMR